MAKLIFSLQGIQLHEYVLDKARITLGRHPSNDIPIDNIAVSAHHAVIVTLGDNSYVEDLDSTNGTLVNDELVKSRVLQDGDIIKLGKCRLQYVRQQARQEIAAPAGQGKNRPLDAPTLSSQATPRRWLPGIADGMEQWLGLFMPCLRTPWLISTSCSSA